MKDIFSNCKSDQLEECYDKLKDRLADYIVDKEYLEKHLYYKYMNEYILKIGIYENELFALDLEIASTKSKIIMIDNLLEKDLPINLMDIELKIQKSFAEYHHILKNNNKTLKEANYQSLIVDFEDEDFLDLNKNFKSLVLLIDPRINKYDNEIIKSLWKKGSTAYKNNELAYLKIIIKLAQDELINIERDTLDKEVSEKNVERLEKMILNIWDEIIVLKEEFPYNWVQILKEHKSIRRIQNDLLNDIKDSKEMLAILQEYFLVLLDDTLFLN